VVAEKPVVIYVISDAVGETADFVSRAAAAQFSGVRTRIRRVSYVQDAAYLDDILEQAAGEGALIVYTIVLSELREYLEKRVAEKGMTAIDILGPLIQAIARQTGTHPSHIPNVVHRLDEQYFRKIEAVEFAVKYDDGKDSRGMLYADVVLVGISRTSKTPLSMYLAHKGIKCANIPLVPEVMPPEELFTIPLQKVIGLVIRPELLTQIRTERLKTLGLGENSGYANTDRIVEELEFSRKIMRRLGCPVIDVTGKAVEETASQVLQFMNKGENHVN
jgi:regulator of PEP synthase PpsR (kinase-PPPase family)